MEVQAHYAERISESILERLPGVMRTSEHQFCWRVNRALTEEWSKVICNWIENGVQISLWVPWYKPDIVNGLPPKKHAEFEKAALENRMPTLHCIETYFRGFHDTACVIEKLAPFIAELYRPRPLKPEFCHQLHWDAVKKHPEFTFIETIWLVDMIQPHWEGFSDFCNLYHARICYCGVMPSQEEIHEALTDTQREEIQTLYQIAANVLYTMELAKKSPLATTPKIVVQEIIAHSLFRILRKNYMTSGMIDSYCAYQYLKIQSLVQISSLRRNLYAPRSRQII